MLTQVVLAFCYCAVRTAGLDCRTFPSTPLIKQCLAERFPPTRARWKILWEIGLNFIRGKGILMTGLPFWTLLFRTPHPQLPFQSFVRHFSWFSTHHWNRWYVEQNIFKKIFFLLQSAGHNSMVFQQMFIKSRTETKNADFVLWRRSKMSLLFFYICLINNICWEMFPESKTLCFTYFYVRIISEFKNLLKIFCRVLFNK
jgi:hypothetical protein